VPVSPALTTTKRTIRAVETGYPAEARVVLVDEAAERVLVALAKCLDQAELGARSSLPGPRTRSASRRSQGASKQRCLRNRRHQSGARAVSLCTSMRQEDTQMSTITVKDGTTIHYKDWGPTNAQPIVFHHGWPLSGDDWDTQMLYFVEKGYRVIAHDRRGHGRSTQVSDGHDMDHYAADVAEVVAHLDVRNAIHIGHSTGGGEATRYAARHGKGRVAKLVLIGAVPPIMVKTPANPGGLPIEVFDGLRQQLAANRAQFYRDLAAGPFYGYNRPDAKVSPAVIENWWRQGMMGGAKAHYDGIRAFSETDFTEDLKVIDVPTLVMHGDDDQIVPIADSAPLSAKLLRKGILKVYEKFPHGMCTTHADVVNADLLAFIKN
jgi:non-heme chloroperoxidase